jgi:hypothetical protein
MVGMLAGNPSCDRVSGPPSRTIPTLSPVPHSSAPAPFRYPAAPEPYTRPDRDRPTPYLIEKSWRIELNRGSGCAVHVGEAKFTTEKVLP